MKITVWTRLNVSLKREGFLILTFDLTRPSCKLVTYFYTSRLHMNLILISYK